MRKKIETVSEDNFALISQDMFYANITKRLFF